MKPILTDEEFNKMMHEYEKVKVKCKHCGHKVVIPVWVDKQLCTWCKYYVYRTPQIEFKEKMKQLIKEK